MSKPKRTRIIAGGGLIVIIFAALIILFSGNTAESEDPWATVVKHRTHLDHAPFFNKDFQKPQHVTLACLECHRNAAADVMKTSHWTWLGEPEKLPGREEEVRLGKRNLINNFCIGIRGGNQAGCTSCHAGYGWVDDHFDFSTVENVDCLICHDWSGTYVKGNGGQPKEGVNLLEVARQVGYPRRENCGICHIYGGGGMGVKHGDLDNTLINPSESVDVHMGRHDLLCIDCHHTKDHRITGKAYSVSIDHRGGIECTDCHPQVPHRDRRINTHLESVACQTCHITTYAKRAPTKIHWDWSKAGDLSREDDAHTYLKIKGEFIYAENVVPEYYWFNLEVDRYLFGDKIDPAAVTHLNPPRGDIHDPAARIWPFKVHRALQPYDKINRYLIQPITSGPGGFWHEFDWDKALRLGAEATALPYSGRYGFARTDMHWPLSHMISPADKALQCNDCHGGRRLDWQALGYEKDPALTGSRKDLNLLDKKEKETLDR